MCNRLSFQFRIGLIICKYRIGPAKRKEQTIMSGTKKKRAKLPRGYKERADGRLEYRFTYEGKRYSVYGSTYKECEELTARKKEEVDKGYIKNKDITMSQYFQEWTAGRKGTVRESTNITVSQRWRRIEPYIGHIKVIELEARQVLRARAAMVEAEVCCTSEINRIVTDVSTLMKSAVLDGIRETNPCRGIKRLQVKDRKPARETNHRAISTKETELFLKYAENSWYYELLCFLLATGVRIGEAAALMWSDVDFKNGIVHITKTVSRIGGGNTVEPPKTRAGIRKIPLTPQALKALRRQKERLGIFNGDIIPIDGRVFTDTRGLDIVPARIDGAIDRIIKKLSATEGINFEHISAHSLRATFATRAIESGMNPKTLQELLGHSDIAMTMNLYAHVMDDTKVTEVSRINLGFVI